LANRDTLLVDSIGAYREPDAAERDTARDTTAIKRETAAKPGVVASSTPPAPKVVQPPPVKAAAPTAAPVLKPAPTVTTPAKPVAAAPKLKGLRACNSATAENQSECIRVSLATVDAPLNRIYRALIAEMRRQEKVPPGGKDPPSVQRLRVSQRAWLVYRDNECRRLGRGKEGALWAKTRAKCLGQFATRRANELADNFSRLTAH
ncbi:MAG TPA: lysozyme inhibitor LprI family protein, partial [Gemmatimonadaceae bacterium]|nr:lysozyme inhibitor LprI family protein [Gemmatimonadaceae bacterium]